MAISCSGWGCTRRTALIIAGVGALSLTLAALVLPAGARATSVSHFCGNTAVGKTPDALLANEKRVNVCVLPVNATMTELGFYLSPGPVKGQQVMRGVLYANSSGKPGALIATTEPVTYKSAQPAGFYHFPFSPSVKLVAGTYWIGMLTGATSKVADEHYNSVKNAEDYNTNTYTSGASNPFGAFKNTNEQMSLYAAYEEVVVKKSSLTIEKLQEIAKSGKGFTKEELSAKVGETVKYEIVVENTGETTLTLSKFTDEKCTNISGGASSLEPHKSTTWLCEHKLGVPGKYTNSASVEANEGVAKQTSNTVTVNAEAATGTCEPSSSIAALIFGKDVLAYVPAGAWDSSATGVGLVNVEGSAVTPTKIETNEAVNSCASNSQTGVTVCTANSATVYIIKEAKIEHELTSGGSGTIGFSGGSCTNCGVSIDSVHHRALIGLSVEGKPEFQFLNLETLTFETPFAASSGAISEDTLIDPTRELILSPAENSVYEVVNVSKPTEPASFDNTLSGPTPDLDSAGEDCQTGIALSTDEGSNQIYLADLTQATFTPGSPGSWTAPSKFETLEEATELGAGTSGVAVAQGTHTGIVTGEFGGSQIVAIALPATSGTGTPALSDYVSCHISEFTQGDDPHTVTAYKSPNSGDAIGLVGNLGGSTLFKVDLTKMLNTSIVKRTAGGHACESGTLPEEVAEKISVP
jgi:hypothetical protein